MAEPQNSHSTDGRAHEEPEDSTGRAAIAEVEPKSAGAVPSSKSRRSTRRSLPPGELPGQPGAAASPQSKRRRGKSVTVTEDVRAGSESPERVGGDDDTDAEAAEPGATEPLATDMLAAIEAILLSSDRPVSAARIAQVLSDVPVGEMPVPAETQQAERHDLTADGRTGEPVLAAVSVRAVKSAVRHLNVQYQQTGRSFRVEALAGGYRVMTLPKFGRVLAALHGVKQKSSLSRAAIETLAIIAYKQPITRAKLEAVRGVSCGEVLRSLTERRLITIAGRAEELGRPMLYATTRQFLEVFGLASTKDLPSPEEFARRMADGGGSDDEGDVDRGG